MRLNRHVPWSRYLLAGVLAFAGLVISATPSSVTGFGVPSALAQTDDPDGDDPPEGDNPDLDPDAPDPDGPKPDGPKPDGTDPPSPDPGADPPEPLPPEPEPAPMPVLEHEDNCTDRIDNDNDSVVDCGDADCASKPECQPTGVREKTSALCSDWIDNDGDGAMDCDDADCAKTSACLGSYGQGKSAGKQHMHGPAKHFALPDLDEGIGVDELIGRFGDANGERNDYTCSDGVDNDGDGRVDCADFGCQFDSQVTVCNPAIGMRLSVVGQIAQEYRIEDTNAAELDQNDWNTAFQLLQLRFLGPIANIENSFFLVNMRVEKTPRVTFAMFQLPIGNMGHYININSGGGGLTSQLIISASKQLLLEPNFLVYSAFEQGNGAAMEIGGPIESSGRLNFRVFGAGGSGRFNGNVGGRFFSDDNTNYTWTAGAQLHLNAIGYMSRFDSPYIYNPEPMRLAFRVGGKFDTRAQERYPAFNAIGTFRFWHFFVQAETYVKREIEFGSTQVSYTAQIGALLWPKHLLLAADFAEYIAGDIENPPADVGDEIRRQRDERQFRAALHWYAYEQTGLISLRYKYRDVKNGRFAEDGFREQELSAIATYRF